MAEQHVPTTVKERERWALDATYTAETQDWAHRIHRLITDVNLANTEVARVGEALDKYGAHWGFDGEGYTCWPDCICGLDKVLHSA